MSFDIPETMHALQVVQKGPAKDALRYNQVKTPNISKPNQLLIKVKAVGVNPIEAKVRSGTVGPMNWLLELPSILGGDYAGVVMAKGNKVTDFEVGDEVYGSLHRPILLQNGTYAEYVVVTLGKGGIAKKPPHMSFEEAAGVGVAMMTAYQGILVQGRLDTKSNNKIIVIGASGGVGSFGVQIAKAIGAQVVAICSGKNKDLVTSLGADRVVDYTQPGELDALTAEDHGERGTFDLILDCIGGDGYYSKLLPLLKQHAVYSTAVGPVEHMGSTPVGIFDVVKLSGTLIHRNLFGSNSYSVITALAWNRFPTEVHPFFQDRKVRTVLPDDQIFDLKDGAKAHLLLESHRTVGKSVLRVS